jgi:hypothetical protein
MVAAAAEFEVFDFSTAVSQRESLPDRMADALRGANKEFERVGPRLQPTRPVRLMNGQK